MIRINLMPHETRSASAGFKLDRMKVIPLAVLGLCLVTCLSVMMVQGTRLSAIQRDVEEAKVESAKYEKTIALINDMVRKEQELNRRLALVEQLDRNRYRTVRVMDEMARRVPRYMWLTALKNVGTDRVAIDGYAFSNLIVSDLMSSLDKSDLFSGTELTVARRKEVEGQKAVGFTVTSTITDTPSES